VVFHVVVPVLYDTLSPRPLSLLQVNLIQEAFHLQETFFDKKSFKIWLKGFMGSVKKYLEEHNPERVDAFVKNVGAVVKERILAKGKFGAVTLSLCSYCRLTFVSPVLSNPSWLCALKIFRTGRALTSVTFPPPPPLSFTVLIALLPPYRRVPVLHW
jgi:translationally controlled tumor-related protein